MLELRVFLLLMYSSCIHTNTGVGDSENLATCEKLESRQDFGAALDSPLKIISAM